MKEYEQKICNIIDNMKAEMRYQCDKVNEQAYKQGHKRGYAEGYELGKQDGYEDGQKSLVNAYVVGKGEDTLEAIKKAEYNRGLNKAWEAAKKIAWMDTETSENITGYFGLFHIMENLTPMQAIEKIKEYEDKREQFAVGDEVRGIDSGKRAVILGKKYGLYRALAFDGIIHEGTEEAFTKTGRTFPQMAEVLAEMKGAENDDK